VILAGNYAPIFIFGLFAAIALAYRRLRSLPARIGLLCLYNLLPQCFGLEIALATWLHFWGSLLIFVWLMRAFVRVRPSLSGRLRRRLAARSPLTSSQPTEARP
jgi:hypothetical protein